MAEVTREELKISVAESLLSVNTKMNGPFIPPTAINWIADDIVKELVPILSRLDAEREQEGGRE